MNRGTQQSAAGRLVFGAGVLAATVALMLSSIGGCASSKANGQRSQTASKQNARSAESDLLSRDPWHRLGYRLEWKGQPVISRGRIVKYFEVFDDALYVQDSGNVATVMELDTGANRWTTTLADPLIRFVGATKDHRGHLMVCSETEAMIHDMRAGTLLERQRFALLVNTAPLVMGNMAIFGGTAGEVLGHNLTSTYKLWGYMMDGSIEVDPVRCGDDLVVVNRNGELAVLSPQDGSLISEGRLYGGLATNPVASERLVFCAGLDQSVWAIERMSGKTAWRLRTEFPLRYQPVYHDGVLYVSIPRRGLVALEASSGKELWTTPDLLGRVVAKKGTRVIAWDGRSGYSIDAVTGEIAEQVVLPDADFIVPQDFADGNLFVASKAGLVQKFSPR